MHDSSFGKMPNVRSYLTGLALGVVLTAIPFALVHFQLLAATAMLFVIAVAAIIQIVIHLKYFLNISLNDTPRENLLALCFATLLIFIMVGGSLWIMFDLHHRMGPLEHQPASIHTGSRHQSGPSHSPGGIPVPGR
jgi:cytochrome o ubiquinol oxidase subunit IV